MKLITDSNRLPQGNILRCLLSELGYNSIASFQKDRGLVVDGLFGLRSYKTLYNILLDVDDIDFEGYYFKTAFNKTQIVWHHSAGWDNARGMFNWWKNDKVQHVATSVGITDSGKVTRGYDEGFWAHHIGAAHWNNLRLNQASIAVEICNWGALSLRKESWAGVRIPNERVIELNYKGIKYFELYTDAEIKALKYWTLLNAMRFNIPLQYRGADMWNVSSRAFSGVAGLYTHNSFLASKSDVSPQPKLIEMAKSLVDYTM